MSQTPDNTSALTPPPDLNRRTILQGAAWTIPAIAVATVAPAASASTTTVLAFNQASYSGTACSTITGAYLTVTVGGTPTAGRSVTTTLSDGYTFADGTTANTQVSDGSGRVNLPSINVPSQGGSGVLSASTASATSASASTSAAPSSSKLVGASWGNTAFPALPAGITATDVTIGAQDPTLYAYFLGSDGYLYQSVNKGAWAKVSPAGVTHISTAFDGGVLYSTGTTVGASWGNTAFPALPAGVTATDVTIGAQGPTLYAYFLGSDGYLYQSVNKGAWAKVSPAGVTHISTAFDGGVLYSTGTTVGASWGNTAFPALPAGITATDVTIGAQGPTLYAYFLGSDGYLYQSVNKGAWTKASPAGVTHISTAFEGGVLYSTGSTVGASWGNTALPALPAGVTATDVTIGAQDPTLYCYFLGSDGYLYQSINKGPWAKVSPAGVTHISTAFSGGVLFALASAC